MSSAATQLPSTPSARRPGSAVPRGSPTSAIFAVAAAAEAGAFGVGMLFDGYYGFAVWGVISLVTLAALVVVLLSGPVAFTRPAAIALCATVALTAWSGLSALWAQSQDAVWTETNRLAFYAACFALALVAIRSVRQARLVVAVLAIASAVAVVYVTFRLLSADAPSMFPQFRLTEPIGYVNGMAGALMMTVWVFVGFVHWTKLPDVVTGIAVGLATLSGCLLVLTQSRAVAPAILISAAVVFVFVPQRVRRAWALVIVACGVLVALPQLLDVYQQTGERLAPSPEVIKRAALWAIAVAFGAGVVWTVASTVERRVTARPIRTASTLLVAAIPLVAAIVALSYTGNPVDWTKRQVDTFTSLKNEAPTNTRYASLSGYRYDLWRVAWGAFREHPVKGLGAGNYPAVFAARRRSPQYVLQTHSIELQALSELGIVGGGLLLVVLGAVAWPLVWRKHRTVGQGDVVLLVVSGGVISVWLAHTSVDWLYNLPSVTGIALVCAAILLARPLEDAGELAAVGRRTSEARRHLLLLLGALGLVVVAGASLGRALAATTYLGRSRAKLEKNPAVALGEARRSLQLNPASVAAYYAQASASARLGDFQGAKESLLAATRREPFNYVPWALLGDLETRYGRPREARGEYRRASSLSPFDPDLRRLAGLPVNPTP